MSGRSGSCPEARLVSGGSDGWGHTNAYSEEVERTREACVGGGVAALLFSYFFSRYLWLHPLDQVLTNRSGPRGAAPAGLS